MLLNGEIARVFSTSPAASAQVLTQPAPLQLSDIGISLTSKSVPAASSACTSIFSSFLAIDNAACQVSSATSEANAMPNLSKSGTQRTSAMTCDSRVAHSSELKSGVTSREPMVHVEQEVNEEHSEAATQPILEPLRRQSAELSKSPDQSRRRDQGGPSFVEFSPSGNISKGHGIFIVQPKDNVDTHSARDNVFVSLHPPQNSDLQEMEIRQTDIRTSQQVSSNLEGLRKYNTSLANSRLSSYDRSTKADISNGGASHSLEEGNCIRRDQTSFGNASTQQRISAGESKTEYGEKSNLHYELQDHPLSFREQLRDMQMPNDEEHGPVFVPTASPTTAMPSHMSSYGRSHTISDRELAHPKRLSMLPNGCVDNMQHYSSSGLMKNGAVIEDANKPEQLLQAKQMSNWDAANFSISTPTNHIFDAKSFERLSAKQSSPNTLIYQYENGMITPEVWHLDNHQESDAFDAQDMIVMEPDASPKYTTIPDVEAKISGLLVHNKMQDLPETMRHQTRQFQNLDYRKSQAFALNPVQIHRIDLMRKTSAETLNPENANYEQSVNSWQYNNDTGRKLRQSSSTAINSSYFEQSRHQLTQKYVDMGPLSPAILQLNRQSLERNPLSLDKVDTKPVSRFLIADLDVMTASQFAAEPGSIREKCPPNRQSSNSSVFGPHPREITNDMLCHVVMLATPVDGAQGSGQQFKNTHQIGSSTMQKKRILTPAACDSLAKNSVRGTLKTYPITAAEAGVVTSHASTLLQEPEHIRIQAETSSKGFLAPNKTSSNKVEPSAATSQSQSPDDIFLLHLNDTLSDPDSDNSVAADGFSPDVDVQSAVQNVQRNILKGRTLFATQPAGRVRSGNMPRVESESVYSTVDEYGEIGLPWDWIEVKNVLNAYNRRRSRDTRDISDRTLCGVEQSPSVQETADVATEEPDSLAEDIVNTLVEMLNENVPLSVLFSNDNLKLHTSLEVGDGAPLPLEEKILPNGSKGGYCCNSEARNQIVTAGCRTASMANFCDYGTYSTEEFGNQGSIFSDDEKREKKLNEKEEEDQKEDFCEETKQEQTEEIEKVLCVLESLHSKLWLSDNIAAPLQQAGASAFAVTHDTLTDRSTTKEISGQIYLHDLRCFTTAADAGYSKVSINRMQASGERAYTANDPPAMQCQQRLAGGAEMRSHHEVTSGAADPHSISNHLDAPLALWEVPAAERPASVSKTSAMATRTTPQVLVDDGRTIADVLTAKSYDLQQESIIYNAERCKSSPQAHSHRVTQGASSTRTAFAADSVVEPVLPSGGRRGEHNDVQERNSQASEATTTPVLPPFSEDALPAREMMAAEPQEQSVAPAALVYPGASWTRGLRAPERTTMSLSVAAQQKADWLKTEERNKMPRRSYMEDAAVGCRLLRPSATAAAAQARAAATSIQNPTNGNRCSEKTLLDASNTVRSAMRAANHRATRTSLQECTVDADCCREGSRVRGRRVNIVLPTTTVYRVASSGTVICETRGTQHEGFRGCEPVRVASEVTHASKSLQTEPLSASSDVQSQFHTAADGPDRTFVSLSETEPEIDSYEQVSAHGGIDDLTISMECDSSELTKSKPDSCVESERLPKTSEPKATSTASVGTNKPKVRHGNSLNSDIRRQFMNYASTYDELQPTERWPSALDGATRTALARHSWQTRMISDAKQQPTAEHSTRSTNDHQKLKRGAFYGSGSGRGGCSGAGARSTVPLLFLVGLPLLSAMILIFFWRSRPKPPAVELILLDTLLELCSVVSLYHWCHA